MSSLHLEKFVLASLLGFTILLIGSAVSSRTCNTQTSLWNQQIQSSANFGSVVMLKCE